MSWLPRLTIWLVCTGTAVFLSTDPWVRQSLVQLTESWCIPAWLYLLPISLCFAWLAAQLALAALNVPRLSAEGKAVFITGCDSGFGYRLSLNLQARGYQVFAGCLFPDGSGAAQLVKDAAAKIHHGADSGSAAKRATLTVVKCDVTSEESLQQAVEEVKAGLNGNVLWAVVANAGIGCYGYAEWVSIENLQKLFDVNTFGVMRTFRAFAPLLRKSKGRLIVTSSWAARFAPPTLVPYAMTKHAVRALCDGLRAELAPFGVHVASIEPNMYRTSLIPTTTKDLDAQWAAIADEQRNSYGQKLLKRSRIMTQDFGYLCQDDLRLPLWCFEHAVSGRFPKMNYVSDRTSMWLFSKLLTCLPAEFTACFTHHVHRVLAFGRNLLPGRYA